MPRGFKNFVLNRCFRAGCSVDSWMLEIMIRHLLHCVSPQEGQGRTEDAGVFCRRAPDPGVNLLFHEFRGGNPES